MTAMDGRNYYELLGVSRTATEEEIKTAYRELARLYHPDSNFYDEIIEQDLPPEALKRFKHLTLAYNTLTNPQKRKDYDEALPPELPGWDNEVASEEFHEAVERRASSAASRNRISAAYGVFGVPNKQVEQNEEQQNEEQQSEEQGEDFNTRIEEHQRKVKSAVSGSRRGLFGKLASLIGK